MTYQEVVHIDNKAEGIIKATYAILYDGLGRKLFALQRRDCEIPFEDLLGGMKPTIENLKEIKDFILPVSKGTYSIVDLSKIDNFKDSKPRGKIGASENVIDFAWDMPVVKATGGKGGVLGSIPVHLIGEAIELIKKKTDKPKYTYYQIKASYEKISFGNWFSPQRVIEDVVYESYEYPREIYRGGLMSRSDFKTVSKFADSNFAKKSLAYVIAFLYEKTGHKSGKGGNGFTSSVGEALKKAFEVNQEEAIRLLVDKYPQYLEKYKDELPKEICYNISTRVDMDEGRYSPEYEELLSKLNTNGIFYVKPGAFDWKATTINNLTVDVQGANGKTVQLPILDAITAAEEKVNKAKAILAIAGSTIII